MNENKTGWQAPKLRSLGSATAAEGGFNQWTLENTPDGTVTGISGQAS